MDGDNFGKRWISQLSLSHGSTASEMAQRLHISIPAFFDGFAQIVTENWPYLERSELQGQKLSLLPAASLDLLFWHCHDVAVTDLAQLLRNHADLRSQRAERQTPRGIIGILLAQYIQYIQY
jgi:hypothetical protein